MLMDCHTHTELSPDSRARLVDMVFAARKLGLDGLCVTDHCDLLDGHGRRADHFDWPAAFAQLDAVQTAEEDFELRLGLELGSAPVDPAGAKSILKAAGNRLDFVLGSLHNWIGERGNEDFYYTDFTDNPALCRQAMENDLDHTWTLVAKCADCYDSLAHIIYPLRYMKRDGQGCSLADYEERVRAILTEVAKTDHALEVNTYRGRDLAPWQPILRWFRACGGRYVTIGSDAHRPEHVGSGLAEAARMVRQAGFPGITVYRKRQPVIVAFPAPAGGGESREQEGRYAH